MPPTILECDQPILQFPPEGIIRVQATIHRKRRAFMICALTRQINEAARDYKQKFCPAGQQANLNECIRLTLGGEGDRGYPGMFARRVCK